MSRLVVIVAVCLLLLLYLRSPIDLLPDRIGGLGLLDDLVAVLVAVWWLRRRGSVLPRPRTTARERARGPGSRGDGPGGGQAGAAADNGEAPWDPWQVLGVARGASREDITRAYREQMKRYHPDRVADLGEELQDLAHRKAQDIQRAYAEIGER